MTTKNVQDYVAQQVQQMSDNKIKPLIESINGELTKIRNLEAQKKHIDDTIAKHNANIGDFQKCMGVAQQEVSDLAAKLTAATASAATGAGPANA